jgi:cytochrome b pre-mRNA-processing protein 3
MYRLRPRPRGRLAGKVESTQYPEKPRRRKVAPAGATKLTFLKTLFGQRDERAQLRPLYEACVAQAREPAWYRDGGVADTLDGRFAMVAAVTALVLLRLEAEGERAKRESVLLTEAFIDDMDSSLREVGIGDFVVGKHVGRLVSALGGRLGAFRDAESLTEPVRRNIFGGEAPDEAKLLFVTERLEALRERLRAAPLDRLLAGEIA